MRSKSGAVTCSSVCVLLTVELTLSTHARAYPICARPLRITQAPQSSRFNVTVM